MEREIRNLEILGVIQDKLNSNHDIVVELSDSQKYTATFFTIINIQYLMAYYEQTTGECNSGNFFWASDMCIISVIDENIIREAINTMLKDDYFDRVFKLVKK